MMERYTISIPWMLKQLGVRRWRCRPMADTRVIFAVVLMIGAVAVIGLVGSLVLSAMGKAVPAEVVAISSGAGGALASILARTSAEKHGDTHG